MNVIMKHCPRCERDLPKTLEYFPFSMSHGKLTARWLCRPCHLTYQKERALLHPPYRKVDPEWAAERVSRDNFEEFLVRLNAKALAAK